MKRSRQHALVVLQNFAEEPPKAVVQPEPNSLILLNMGAVPMDQTMSDLAAPDPLAPCSSVTAHRYSKPEIRTAFHQGTCNHAGSGFVWVALPGGTQAHRQ